MTPILRLPQNFLSFAIKHPYDMKSKALIGISVIALAFAPAKKVDLGFKLEKGKTYTQTTEVKSHIKQTIQGQAMETDNVITGTTSFRLKEAGKDGNIYEVSYESIGMKITTMGQTQEFTSDTTKLPQVDPMSRVFSHMTNDSFTAKISTDGEVSEVSGLDEIIQKSANMVGGGNPQMADQLSSSFGDEGLAKNVEMLTDIFPDESVNVGDSWTINKGTATGMPILAENTYTLASIDGGVAVLNLKSELKTDPENSSTQMQGMSAQYFLEGTRTGTLKVEVKTGWVTHADFTDDIFGSITIAPNAQLPDGMTIPIEVKNVATISGE